jgi:hypothetical protein
MITCSDGQFSAGARAACHITYPRETSALLDMGRAADRTIRAGGRCARVLVPRASGSQNRRSSPLPAGLATPVPSVPVESGADPITLFARDRLQTAASTESSSGGGSSWR